jgi:hypothetical protein
MHELVRWAQQERHILQGREMNLEKCAALVKVIFGIEREVCNMATVRTFLCP